ncbi:PCRF domain-containing protein [Candidatus Vidania fulgoroideae]|nr:PCRF domain-containing protein [Candidatus Vidania fulgoroideae]
MRKLINYSANQEDIKYIQKETNIVLKNIKKIEKNIFFKKKKDCYIEIFSKKGGQDSSYCVNILFEQYVNFFYREKIIFNVLKTKVNKININKYLLIFIKDEFELLKGENGINKFIKKSNTKKSEIKHTCYCSVKITSISINNKIDIKKEDITISSFKASGAGGQHVNKTNSAVRIKHIPTGITVSCQNQRSQLQNKNEAVKILKFKLEKKNKKKKMRYFNERIIRIYFIEENLVVDKRVNIKNKFSNYKKGKIYEEVLLNKINEKNRKNFKY